MFDTILLTAATMGLGAVVRATIGYSIKVRNNPKTKWNWTVFGTTTLPALAAGFAAGAALQEVPNAFSAAWFSFILTSVVGGAGTGSAVSNVLKLLTKKA